jgi:chaperonin GroES
VKDNMNIQPLHDKVLIAENKREETTSSGIILDSQGTGESKSGTVLAIGPEVTDVKVGDVVYLMWNKAQVVKVGDAQRVIIKQEDIVAVLEN